MQLQLGVMQGRLLPKYQGRYQAHPVGYWQDEFALAQELGLNLIEFIIDYDQAEKNPLLLSAGVKSILQLGEQTGVRVRTVCADYLMTAPLQAKSREIAVASSQMLQTLLTNAKAAGITTIVIPCVDQATLQNEAQMERFRENIEPARELAAKLGMSLAVESDLPPQRLREFLTFLASPVFTVNYDTGNSAALGYDYLSELAAYGERIADIHLKDRLCGGNSVVLGTGAVDFQGFLAALARIAYQGPLIMQAYRDEEGLGIFGRQLAWLRALLAKEEKR